MSIALPLTSVNLDELELSYYDKYTKKTQTLFCYKTEGDTCYVPIHHAITTYKKSIPPKPQVKLNFIAELRPYQKQLLPKLIEQLKKNHTLFMAVYCSWGKTVTALKLAAELGYPTLITADMILIIDGWISSCEKYLGIKPFVIRGKCEIPKNEKIYICNINTLHKIDPQSLAHVGTLIVDEAKDFATQKRYNTILGFQVCKLILLSANIDRNDTFDRSFEFLVGPRDKFIRQIWTQGMKVFKFNTTFRPTIQINRYTRTVDWHTVIQSICMNEERNKLIAELAIVNQMKKVLVLCKLKPQAKMIYDILDKRGIKVGLIIGATKKYKCCDILVSTYSKAGKGFDQASIEEEWDGRRFQLLIHGFDICDPEQSIGRVFRSDDPECYDLVDDYSSFRKHWEENRQPWYLERNASMVEEWI